MENSIVTDALSESWKTHVTNCPEITGSKGIEDTIRDHAIEDDFLKNISSSIGLNQPKIKYIIHRYDYDAEIPTRRIVGFKVVNPISNQSEYFETQIPIEEVKNKEDQEVLDMAFERLKDQISQFKKKTISLVGKEFLPISDDA